MTARASPPLPSDPPQANAPSGEGRRLVNSASHAISYRCDTDLSSPHRHRPGGRRDGRGGGGDGDGGGGGWRAAVTGGPCAPPPPPPPGRRRGEPPCPPLPPPAATGRHGGPVFLPRPSLARAIRVLSHLLILLSLPRGTSQGLNERRLLTWLLNPLRHNPLERPVVNESHALVVQFGLTLQQIIDVDEKNQILTTNIWLNMDEKNQMISTNIWLNVVWNNYNLAWNESEYGGIDNVRIPPHMIWKPDVLMYNSADEDIDSTFPTNIVLSSNGDCMWIPPGLFLSTCRIDITWFPFDDQRCEMKFGSWTYDGSAIDLQLKGEGGDISTFIPNGEWELIGLPALRNVLQYDCCPEQYVDLTFTIMIRRRKLYYVFNLVVPCIMMSALSLLVFAMPPDAGEKITCGVPAVRNVVQYDCCPEQYIDITFTIHIRRRTLYYGFNLIIPCVLISSMALLTFVLPPDAGEKISLGVTILLSLTVFLLLVAETMPPTSDAVPLIGWYFACIMLMCSLSVVFTVLVLNYHHRTPDTHHMPQWVKVGVCDWLAWLLRMKRPGKHPTPKRVMKNARMRDFELRERSSRSLLANVLDLEDDFRGLGTQTNNYSSVLKMDNEARGNSHFNSHSNQHYMGGLGMNNAGSGGYPAAAASPAGEPSMIKEVLKELRYLTEKMKRDEDFSDQCNDWKFAAMVIDRLCLFLFTMFTVGSTFAILFSAPNMLN